MQIQSNISTRVYCHQFTVQKKKKKTQPPLPPAKIENIISWPAVSYQDTQKEITLSKITAIRYYSIRLQCFIYRTPNWQIIELHNEYTNAFPRIELESCFHENAFWLNYWHAVRWQSGGAVTRMRCWRLMEWISCSEKKWKLKYLSEVCVSLSLWPYSLKNSRMHVKQPSLYKGTQGFEEFPSE